MSNEYKVNGKIVRIKPSVSRFSRTANEIKKEILHNLGKIGITPEYIDIEMPRNALIRDTPAEISWYVNGENYFYSCSTQACYRDNLGVIGKLIEIESYAIRNGLKSFAQVMNQFRLGYDSGSPTIKTPREILGISVEIKDLDYIKFKYKELAKKYHPDNSETGDAEMFKQVNDAFKTLQEEFK